MVRFYTNYFTPKLLIFSLIFLPMVTLANTPGGPVDPDSLAQRGHCSTVIKIDTLCGSGEIQLSAFILWTFTQYMEPIQATWNTGENAHKIRVVPPGTWSWEPGITTCEPNHWYNEVTINSSFFAGPIQITGETVICPFDGPLELTLNINGYSEFSSLVWSPPNPTGQIEPYPVVNGGTYQISVTDAFGCTSSDDITVVKVAPFTVGITGTNRICPEGDTAILSVLDPALYSSYEWSNGDMFSPIMVTEPGPYQVVATDVYGCTGIGNFSVQSGGVDPFDITMSSPSLCPGAVDTLRVLGGYSNYSWSNNVMGITNIVNQAGAYTVTVTNIYGCTGTSSTTVSPLLPPNIQISSTPLCLGDTAMLTIPGANFPQYDWSSGQSSDTIFTTVPGTYSVTVSGAGICTTSTNTILDFAVPPVSLIVPPATLNCLETQITLDGTGSSMGPDFPLIWMTPDGNFVSGSDTLNPIVDQPGTYILSISSAINGCTTNDTVLVLQNIMAPPANAGLPDTLNCTFQNFAIGPIPTPIDTSLVPLWSTPDGNILSGSDTWAPDVDQPGNYFITVTDSINGCSSIDSVLIVQDIANPVAAIAPPNLITCMETVVGLDGAGSSSGPEFSYLWTSPNGTIVGQNDSISAAAASSGIYVLVVTNTQNGCTALAATAVDADIDIPVLTALSPDTLNCLLDTTLIDATMSSSGPTYQYSWTTQDGNIVADGNTLIPTVDAPGTYTLNLLNTANNCTATLSVIVPQDISPPNAVANPGDTLTCNTSSSILDGLGSSVGADFSYNWTSVDGNIVSGNNALNPEVDQPGNYILQVTDQINGCTSTASAQIQIDTIAPIALIAPAATLSCSTLQTTLDATASNQMANMSYDWIGAIQSGQGTLQAIVDQPGLYTLIITDNNNGCSAEATVLVDQDIATPIAEAGPNVLINCINPTGSLGTLNNPSGAGFSLLWTTVGGNFTSPTDSATVAIDQAGNYQLLVSNLQNGCTASDNVTVTADFAPPVADAGPGTVLTCAQTSLSLQGTGSSGPDFSYLWTSPDGNISSGANTLNPIVSEPGSYNLLVTNTQNGCTATSQVIITDNSDGPIASAGLPQTLTCLLGSTTLSAAGSSTGPEFTYTWSTANGNISAGANTLTPSIDAPGTYVVTVTNTTNLCTETASVTILQDIQAPIVDAGVDNTLTCAVTNLPLQGQIISSSSTNIGYQWDTPDGQIVSGGNTAGPVIGAPGTYLLTVTDAINGCTGTDQLQISEDISPPTAQIENPPTLTCAVEQVTINASSSSSGANFDYSWSSPTGNIVSAQNPQQPVVDAPGLYNLLITNTLNGCTQMASVTVPEDVALPLVEAGPTVGLNCAIQTIALDGTGSSQGANFTYTWSTSNGQILSGGNTLSPTIGDEGDYVLSILNTLNGCSNSDNVIVTQDIQAPVLTIATPQSLTCALLSLTLDGAGNGFGSAPTISWTTSDGNIVTGGNSLMPTVDAPGNYTLTVQNTDNGCGSTTSITVLENIQAPPIQVQPVPLLTCSVLQLPLQSTVPAQSTIDWTTQNGHIVSGTNSPNPIVDQPGLYLLTVTSTLNGCTNTADVAVQRELNVPTGLAFSLAPPLCNGTPGLLTVEQVDGGVGPYTYSLNGGATFFSVAEFNNVMPGSYDLVIQDINGCELAEAIDVPSPPIPLVTLPPEFEIKLGDFQQLLALVPAPFPISLVDTVIWAPLEGLSFESSSITDLLMPTAQPFQSTEYSVTIITEEGCKSVARTRIIVDRELDIYVPNIIWPEDPDGNNGTFMVFAREASVTKIKQLQIFDRWGSLVFEQKDFLPNEASLGWQGDYRGSPVNPGVFVWWLEVELVDGRTFLMKGDVTVQR